MDLAALSIWVKTIIVFGVLIVFLSSGMWVALALAATGIFVLAFMAGGIQRIIDSLLFNSVDSFVLIAIPMFIFLGEIILRTGLNTGLYRGVSKWTAIIPGGLLHSNILASAIFAAVCGSSVATAATISSVAYGDQKARGYNYRLIGGSLAAGGTLGILIPPSITMIVYGDFVGVSVARLFAAGVIPGAILAASFMAVIYMTSLADPKLVPPRQPFTLAYFKSALGAFMDIWPILLIIVVIFVGIYGGLMTPEEAAAVSCFIALLIALGTRRLNLNIYKEAVFNTLQTTGMVLLIVVFAKILGTGVALIKLPADLASFVVGLDLSRMFVWAGVALMLLILGMFIESLPMMLLTLPVTFPLLVGELGFDPLWFGIAQVVLTELALVTPPVALNLYVIHGIAKGERFEDLMIGILPFIAVLVAMVLLITALPAIVTWFPDLIMPRF